MPSKAAAFFLILSWGATAAARDEYPGIIAEKLDMPCTPACTLCHTDPNGGADHLNQFAPLGLLTVLSPMPPPLAGDLDRDGVSDGEELKKGQNPGVYGDYSICAPTHGCGARLAPAPREQGDASGWLFTTLALVAWRVASRAAKRS